MKFNAMKPNVMKPSVMKLYEVPRDTFIKYTNNCGEIFKVFFHHVDGMYSYCTYQEKVVHLPASEEVELWDDKIDVEYLESEIKT